MLQKYSKKKTGQIIDSLDDPINEAEFLYGVPAACLRGILYQEIADMDWLDAAADLIVRMHWAVYRIFGKEPGGLLRKRDSSTGYAQVFAATAIRGLHFAVSHGFPLPAADSPDDLCSVWRRLHADKRFNTLCAALTLLNAAEEMTGSTDFQSFSPEEMQLVLSRYNARTDHITAYGKAAYQQYLEYQKAS